MSENSWLYRWTVIQLSIACLIEIEIEQLGAIYHRILNEVCGMQKLFLGDALGHFGRIPCNGDILQGPEESSEESPKIWSIACLSFRRRLRGQMAKKE